MKGDSFNVADGWNRSEIAALIYFVPIDDDIANKHGLGFLSIFAAGLQSLTFGIGLWPLTPAFDRFAAFLVLYDIILRFGGPPVNSIRSITAVQ